MAIEIITREDLNEFRSLLLNDLKEIIQSKPLQTKQWLGNISPGALQNLRINGTLSYKSNEVLSLAYYLYYEETLSRFRTHYKGLS